MLVSKYKMNSSSENKTIKIKKKMKKLWPGRDLNTQPSDLESDALPLRHQAINYLQIDINIILKYSICCYGNGWFVLLIVLIYKSVEKKIVWIDEIEY